MGGAPNPGERSDEGGSDPEEDAGPSGQAFDFAAFSTTYYERLRRRAQVTAGRRGDPDDVLHEVLIRLLRTKLPIHTVRDALAFCVTNMKWVATDNARHAARAVPVSEFTEAAGGTTPDPADTVTERAVLELAHSFLTEQQREIWTAIEVDGESHPDVSARTGLSPESVRSTLYRAWERLRRNADAFRVIIAGLVLAPRRRREPFWLRHEQTWLAAGSAIAGLTLVAAAHGTAARPGVATPPPTAGAPGAAPLLRNAKQEDRTSWLVRDSLPRAAGRAGVVSHSEPSDTAPPSRRKLGGCVSGIACLSEPGDSRARNGHGVWVFPQGGNPVANELYTDLLPVCDVLGPAATVAPWSQSYVGCTSYGATSPFPGEDRG